MTHIEMVEKLRERADVNYADAKDALERTNWDLLDAMILLEKEGKIRSDETAISPADQSQESYSTKNSGDNGNSGKNSHNCDREKWEPRGTTFRELMGKFFRWVGKVLHLGNVNHFVVERYGNQSLSLPVTVLVVLLIIGFWVVVPLIIVGLFFGYRYSFMGPNLGRENINDAMHKASNVAESIKDEFKKGSENSES